MLKSYKEPYALHSCNIKACVNPGHLRWGSQQENMDDYEETNPNRNENPRDPVTGRYT